MEVLVREKLFIPLYISVRTYDKYVEVKKSRGIVGSPTTRNDSFLFLSEIYRASQG